MNKRLKDQYDEFKYHGENTPFSLGTLVVCMLCLLGLIVGTFTQLNVVHYWPQLDANSQLIAGLRSFKYIPQVPIVLFTAAVLGARFGILTLILYLITGFFIWPVFALGGGLGYIKSYFFGYILGYFPAIILTARILKKDFSYKGIAYAAFLGVVFIHLTGVIYTGLLGIFKLVNFSFMSAAIYSLSGVKIIYDLIFSFIALSFAKPVKNILWLAMKNTSKPVRISNPTGSFKNSQ